jgi:hypothetical protein
VAIYFVSDKVNSVLPFFSGEGSVELVLSCDEANDVDAF